MVTLSGSTSLRTTVAGRLKEMKNGWKARILTTGATPRPAVEWRQMVEPVHSVIEWGRLRLRVTLLEFLTINRYTAPYRYIFGHLRTG